jgi:uncharacterized membrane protein
MKKAKQPLDIALDFVTKRVWSFRPILYVMVFFAYFALDAISQISASSVIVRGQLVEAVLGTVGLLCCLVYLLITGFTYMFCFFDAVDRTWSKNGSLSAAIELLLYLMLYVAAILWHLRLIALGNSDGGEIVIMFAITILLGLQIRHFVSHRDVVLGHRQAKGS